MNCKNWCVAFTECIDNSRVASRLSGISVIIIIIIIIMASVITEEEKNSMKNWLLEQTLREVVWHNLLCKSTTLKR